MTPEQLAKMHEVLRPFAKPEPTLPESPPSQVALDIPPAVPSAVEQTKKRRAQLYSSERRGYMRSTIEEGVTEELRVMNEDARGSPFFDKAQPTPRKTEALVARDVPK